MSKSNATENDVLKMMLQGIDPSWRANAVMYVALYTADPGEAGTAVTNEADYGGYARVPVTKATAWVDNGSLFANSGLVQFPQCTSGDNAITHFGLVVPASGAGQLLTSGALSSVLNVSSGIQPQFAPGDLEVEED